jgi:predicted secreted protein
MGEFLFISLFLWWVVLFIMRTIRESRSEGEEDGGGATTQDTFFECHASLLVAFRSRWD